MELQPGADFAGRFRVGRKLGGGGCGAVYEAREIAGVAPLALKVLHPEHLAHPTLRERFEQEAPIARSIPSAHVVTVLDAGVDRVTHCPWVALELLSGEPLDRRLAREPLLPRELVVRLFAELLDVLGAAHQRGIIHADLKPENLFLVGPAERPMLKVLDFGIARVIQAGRTSTKVTTEMGTPAWSAPEQFRRGAKMRPSTDVWSLGLLAFHLLTGKHYLQQADASVLALLAEILHAPLPIASERARALGVEARLPAGFDAWFRLCVDREQEARFQHGRAALTALGGLLHPSRDAGGTVVLSEPPRPPQSAWRGTVALPDAWFAEVVAALDRHDYAGAQRALALATAAPDAPTEVWALRGECAHRMGRYEEAVACWSEAIERQPEAAAFLHGRALVFEAQGQVAAARADLAQAAAKGYDPARAHLLRLRRAAQEVAR